MDLEYDDFHKQYFYYYIFMKIDIRLSDLSFRLYSYNSIL